MLLITFSVSQDIRKAGVYHVEEFSGFYLNLCELQKADQLRFCFTCLQCCGQQGRSAWSLKWTAGVFVFLVCLMGTFQYFACLAPNF